MQELDVRSIFYLLLARIKWIILAFVIGAVLLGGYSTLFMPEQYVSSALLYVKNVTSEYDSSAATSSNLTASERLVKTVQVATTTETTLQEVSTKLNGRMTASELKSVTSFSLTEETSFLKISITHTDADLAKEACNMMAQAAVDAFTHTGEVGEAKVFEEAVDAKQVSPNVTKNAIVGALVGTVIAVAIVLLRAMFDNTIRDKEDIRTRIGVPVLGEIPSFDLAVRGGRNRG